MSYAAFVVVVGVVLFAVGILLLRFVPEGNLVGSDGDVIPSRSDLMDVFIRYALDALLLLSVLGFGGGWLLARQMLKPLTRITAAAHAARDGSLDHRIRMPGRQTELAELSDTFDDMLDRLQRTLEAQQRFAANASHELRTPLAVTATMLDVASRHPEKQNYDELVERLRATNDRAVRLTEALLRLADADAIDAVAEPVDIAVLVRVALIESADEATERGVTVTSALHPAISIGDEALLSQIVTNLVHNSIRHSGKQGQALVSTRFDPDHGTAILRTENTGPIYEADTIARLPEPFLRGAGRVAGPQQGYGLGLALVERIVAAHGGSFDIAPRSNGGLIITVALPGAGADGFSRPEVRPHASSRPRRR
ncbi:two-component system sensor histidine kinase VanS [Microbacterium halimionae]|uniref:histidine kinase n=1 Tax=Microbacterium halimionae TaxID=1526413 RepID=A0A7W3JMF2_9MICO|nr:HAMP domain-containing sensor histidine kinase [Microbacterium halimionae]MBA8815559.1 two-component system sensor histidine kinase VanS [Microbacterium halimionae]NII95605.1 two-component system sensor histidine kinase VanS [Microbacterium halimionae]